MALLKTKGIIINRWVYGEADRILTILTPHLGKISAIAKSARRISSKLGGNLELFYIVDWVLAEGKTWYVITAAETQETFPGIRVNLDKTSQAGYLCYLINSLILEGESHFKIYQLLRSYLHFIAVNHHSLTPRQFEWQLLNELGHKIELYNCVRCKSKPSQTAFRLSVINGGLICADCMSRVSDAITTTLNTLKILRLFLKESSILVNRLPYNERTEKELALINKLFLEMVLEKPLPINLMARNNSNSIKR